VAIAADLVIAIVSGLLSALIYAVGGRFIRLRRIRQAAEWFGSMPGDNWVVLLPRFTGDDRAVYYRLLEAVREITVLAESVRCSVHPELNDHMSELGDVTEFSVGGGGLEGTRPRVHLKTWVPSFRFRYDGEIGPDTDFDIVLGDDVYPYTRGVSEYALLARFRPSPASRPVFLVSGQGARSDIGAVTFLRKNHAKLRDRFGEGHFGLLLHIKESEKYGASLVSEVCEVPVLAAPTNNGEIR
jgi:hypothetical protein